MATLTLPVTDVHRSFLSAMEELRAEGRGGPADNTMIGHDIREWSGRWDSPEGFSAYVSALRAQSDEETPRPEGWVPDTTWWWVEGRSSWAGSRCVTG